MADGSAQPEIIGDSRTIFRSRRIGGEPVASIARSPGVPPVGALRLTLPQLPAPGPHAHDFLVLAYFERGGGTLLVGGREWRLRAGDAFAIPPAAVVAAHGGGTGWAAFLPVDLLARPGVELAWRAHPLLAAFTGERVTVPAADRLAWGERFAALERELLECREGFAEAAVAHVTLLLIALSRLAVRRPHAPEDPLLAALFAFIERRFAEPISLRDAARALNLTPGHLTTVVRERTGRTVLEWIVERRMAEARRLLAESDLTVQAVGEATGYRDPGYFARVFRRAHGVSPLAWRRS